MGLVHQIQSVFRSQFSQHGACYLALESSLLSKLLYFSESDRWPHVPSPYTHSFGDWSSSRYSGNLRL